MKTSSAFHALLRRSDQLGLPKSFATDLTKHDRRALSGRDNARPFGWVLHRDGTYIVVPEYGAAVRLASAICEHAKRSCQDVHAFWWDGSALHEVSLDELPRLVRRASSPGLCVACGE